MKLLIWDLDGTLVDSRADIATAANLALRAIGRAPLPQATIVTFIGDGIGMLIERLTPDGAAEERSRCRIAFEATYAQHGCADTAAYPGVRETLSALHADGWTQAVATNKAMAFTTPILAHCGLSEFFFTVRGGDGRRKPDPWPLLDIMRELGAEAQHTWMIGDHHTDILAAHAAGCRMLFCTWGLGQRAGHEVTVEADTPAMVRDVLNSRQND